MQCMNDAYIMLNKGRIQRDGPRQMDQVLHVQMRCSMPAASQSVPCSTVSGSFESPVNMKADLAALCVT